MAVATAVPADAGELWEHYGDYLLGLVIKLGIPHQDAADVLGIIMVRLLEQDVLGMYRADHISEHTGRPVTFRAFISHQVAIRVRGQRDKLGRLALRENLICDAADESGTKWVELFGGQWWDDYSHLDTGQFLSRMRAHLAMQPPRSPADRCDLVALFDELVAEVQQDGKVSRAQVCERFGIAPATATSWVKRLRGVLRATEDSDSTVKPISWVIGGVTLTYFQVRQAAELLDAAKGIKVREPLTQHGHPLKDAEPRWYHPFAKDEIKAFPEIAIDPQTHRKPAGHVKVAVLHRLNRMLAEAAAEMENGAPAKDAPQTAGPAGTTLSGTASEDSIAEPPTALDLIEAELFQLGADVAKVDYILGLARSVPAA